MLFFWQRPSEYGVDGEVEALLHAYEYALAKAFHFERDRILNGEKENSPALARVNWLEAEAARKAFIERIGTGEVPNR